MDDQKLWDKSDIYESDGETFFSDDEECNDSSNINDTSRGNTVMNISKEPPANGSLIKKLASGCDMPRRRGERRMPGIYRLDDEVNVNDDRSYRSYINGTVTVDDTGRQVPTKLFLDAGNLLSQGCAISERFFKRSGAHMVRRIQKRCSTAKKGRGSALTMVGVCSPLTIRVRGMTKSLHIPAPVILKDLADDINLGNRCLQIWNVNLTFQDHGTTLSDNVSGDNIPLISRISDRGENTHAANEVPRGRPIERGKSVSTGGSPAPTQIIQVPIEAKTEHVLKPNQLTFVDVKSWKTGRVVMIEPLRNDALCQAVPGIYTNMLRVAVINLGETAVTIKPDHIIGWCQQCTVVDTEDN